MLLTAAYGLVNEKLGRMRGIYTWRTRAIIPLTLPRLEKGGLNIELGDSLLEKGGRRCEYTHTYGRARDQLLSFLLSDSVLSAIWGNKSFQFWRFPSWTFTLSIWS